MTLLHLKVAPGGLRQLGTKLTTVCCLSTVCKDIPSDLLFLIDSSTSILPIEYQKMKDFMKSVISRSIIGQDNVRVGVIQFSSEIRQEFALNMFYSREEKFKAIDDMQQLGGSTHTGEAIGHVSQYFDSSRGGRPDLWQRLVVITDGQSQDEVKIPAETLRSKGVVIYAIGVVNANETQLLEISGSEDKMYWKTDFDALKDLERNLAYELCDPERGTVTSRNNIQSCVYF